MSVGAIGQVDLANQISVAVARKGLDVAEQQGAAIVELIRAAGETHRGTISSRPGTGEAGQRLDVSA